MGAGKSAPGQGSVVLLMPEGSNAGATGYQGRLYHERAGADTYLATQPAISTTMIFDEVALGAAVVRFAEAVRVRRSQNPAVSANSQLAD